MSNEPLPVPSSPITPCTGVCRLDSLGYCMGCRRTIDEIGRWRGMSEAERLHVMRNVLPSRARP